MQHLRYVNLCARGRAPSKRMYILYLGAEVVVAVQGGSVEELTNYLPDVAVRNRWRRLVVGSNRVDPWLGFMSHGR